MARPMRWCSSFRRSPQQRVVGHVLGQGVLEHVGQLGNALRLVDQLDGLELAQEPRRWALRRPRGGRASRRVNSRPITEASCSVLLGRLVQPVDAGHDHVLDRVGDDDVVEAAAST